MKLNTDFLQRCIRTLDQALEQLAAVDPDDTMYDIMRAACVKEFELVSEQCAVLLRKRLRPYFASNRQADRLTFKNLYRHGAKHGLLTVEECERWLQYRDIRNDTAHRYGEAFAELALQALPGFVTDAKALAAVLAEPFDD